MYFSKSFPTTLQVASTYTKELVAIVETLKKWHHYLFGEHFTIVTAYDNLKHLMSQTVHTPYQWKFIRNLMGYKYYIVYCKGKDNVIDDALLRKEDSSPLAVSSPELESFLTFIDQLEDPTPATLGSGVP